MPLWPRILSLWRNVSRGEQVDRDLDEELRAHLALLIEEKISSGMGQAEARRAALIEFGGVDQTKERVRASRTGFLLETLWQDLRYGVRMLARSPGFTATAVVSLALGIGATTSVFSVLDTIFLRPLPYPEPERLAAVYEIELGKPDGGYGVSQPNFIDWKKQSQSFEQLAQTLGPTPFVISRSEGAVEVPAQFVTDGYFQMLGARACQGRLFVADEYTRGKTAPVVLSYGLWQRLFGSNPSIIGNTINVNGGLVEVVGVMCSDFHGRGEIGTDIWLSWNWLEKDRKVRNFDVIGRLKPGISIEMAQAEMDVIAARLAGQYPEQKGFGARVMSLQQYLYSDQKMRFLAFSGAVAFVLLIACANVANLLLARGATRQKEMAVRASLGGNRARLVRQLLTESILLSCLGTGAGLLLAFALVRLAVHFSPEYAIPRAGEIAPDMRILGFTVMVAFLTGLLFGLFPALSASKPDLNESLKEAGHRQGARPGGMRAQSFLVMAQVALSLALLTGAGLMIHNLWRLLHMGVGFNTEGLVQMTIGFVRADYLEDIPGFRRMKPRTVSTVAGIVENLRALPGVKAVSVSTSGVLQGINLRPVNAGIKPVLQSEEGSCYEPVSSDFFKMLEIPVLKGRGFTEWDSENSPPVAVISESVARRYFGGEDPVGKLISIGLWDFDDIERREVVGVVPDIRQIVVERPFPTVYYPYPQLSAKFRFGYGNEHLYATFLVRTAGDPASLGPVMKRAALEVAKDITVSEVLTIEDIRSQTAQWSEFDTRLLVAFAATALALAAVGIFGVTSYSVAQRTHEIGVRIALGADYGDVLWLVLKRGLSMTLIGSLIGLLSSLWLARFLVSELRLNEVESSDPATLVAVCLLLALVALLACYIPARRAARMNPLTSLRYE